MNNLIRFSKPKFASALVLLFAAGAAAQAQAADADSVWPDESAATISFGVPGFDDAPQSAATARFVDPMAAVDGGRQDTAAADSATTLSFADTDAAQARPAVQGPAMIAAGERPLQSPSSQTSSD